MSLIVAARFTTFPVAEDAAQKLFNSGYVEEDVTLFFVNPRGQHARYPIGGDTSTDSGAKDAPTGAGVGVTIGAVAGAVVGVAIFAAFSAPVIVSLIAAGGRCLHRLVDRRDDAHAGWQFGAPPAFPRGGVTRLGRARRGARVAG
nr:hypothetical protein HUO10_005284 [Paraburkholderia busanensis]